MLNYIYLGQTETVIHGIWIREPLTICAEIKSYLREFGLKLAQKIHIKVADGRYVECGALGDIFLNCASNERSFVMHLEDVNYVPKLSSNLISVNKLSKYGYTTVFTGEFCEVFQAGKSILKIKSKANGLYELKPVSIRLVLFLMKRFKPIASILGI